MTTNKPEVVAWLHSVRQDSDVITSRVRNVWGAPLGSMGEYTVALIRLADHERLQADHEAARAADKARIAELESALSECAASLAWNCFGECRAVHDGPIMPAQMALEYARAALAANQKRETSHDNQ